MGSLIGSAATRPACRVRLDLDVLGADDLAEELPADGEAHPHIELLGSALAPFPENREARLAAPHRLGGNLFDGEPADAPALRVRADGVT